MSKTDIVNKQIGKKPQRKTTKIQQFVDTLARTKFPEKLFDYFQKRYVITDSFYDNVQEPWFDAQIEELHNKATEQNILQALRKNKKFKQIFEDSLAEIAKEISISIDDTHRNVIADRKAQIEAAKKQEKLEEEKRKEKAKIEQEQKKRAFELSMFKESLDKKQLKDLKKFYGVDLNATPAVVKK